jgi:hypothetical protein
LCSDALMKLFSQKSAAAGSGRDPRMGSASGKALPSGFGQRLGPTSDRWAGLSTWAGLAPDCCGRGLVSEKHLAFVQCLRFAYLLSCPASHPICSHTGRTGRAIPLIPI